MQRAAVNGFVRNRLTVLNGGAAPARRSGRADATPARGRRSRGRSRRMPLFAGALAVADRDDRRCRRSPTRAQTRASSASAPPA